MEAMHATELLASIDDGRLIVFCGAGLSMPRPSESPSAAALSHNCADKYTAATGQPLEPGVRDNLEKLAELFLSSPPLRASFRDRYIEWARFNGEPNAGHFAIADFLGCKAAQAAISTNVDFLVEKAAERLGEEDFRAAVEGQEATRLCLHSPMLKIHGCMSRNRDRIIWTREQIGNGPLRDANIVSQLGVWRAWLAANLQGRDLVIIGFWSDWSYLNEIFSGVLVGSDPAVVYLVDPAAEHDLQAKAPGLWALAQRAASFRHVRESGADFISELRRRFSRLFLTNVFRESEPSYQALTGTPPLNPVIPDGLTNDELYELRRDICGVGHNRIVRNSRPEPHMRTTGAIHLLMQSKGAQLTGARYIHNNRTVRPLNGAGQVLSLVRAEFSANQPNVGTHEIVICDAQADGNAPADILREGTAATIVRAGSNAEWVTFQRARELGYC